MNDWRSLFTAEGQAALVAAMQLQPTTATLLACHQRLRKQFPDHLVRLALETAQLRSKAAPKFTRAAAMYFTRTALEQSSGEVIATHRGQRYAGYARVGDFCCGIGGDVLGLAAHTHVVAVDMDADRVRLAEANVQVYERTGRVQFVTGELLANLPEVDAAFFDPDRRADGQRHVRIRDYVPALDAVQARLPKDFPLGVKVAPGVAWHELQEYAAEKEFLSVGGELKECVLWFGPLQTTTRRATILPANATLYGEPLPAVEPCEPLAYLYDPDPAIIRAGLVSNLGALLNAQPIDASIAYLTSATFTPTPFATVYAIEEALPFHAKKIGARLRALNFGHVTITKRGSAIDVDELRRKWKLDGDETRVVILTRVQDAPFALIGRVQR